MKKYQDEAAIRPLTVGELLDEMIGPHAIQSVPSEDEQIQVVAGRGAGAKVLRRILGDYLSRQMEEMGRRADPSAQIPSLLAWLTIPPGRRLPPIEPVIEALKLLPADAVGLTQLLIPSWRQRSMAGEDIHQEARAWLEAAVARGME